MDRCDVLIVGGGPAGSSCARDLVRAGLDVLVMDRAVFPRDKTCAGWITPQVVADLELDLNDYHNGRTLQTIRAMRTGVIGRRDTLDTRYDDPISYGIRRCEFDDYLLRRSGARLRLGAAASHIRRDGAAWIVDGRVRARMLVGAGGQFCPVARLLNPTRAAESLVVAQEGEFTLPGDLARSVRVDPETPELYFCRDLKGYGWCLMKERHLNVGIGRLDRRSLPAAAADFVRFLRTIGRIPEGLSWTWRGHAYLVASSPRRRLSDDGALLVGDAAGLAYARSGEGIRPAIESGRIAATVIAAADGCYTRDRLAPYLARLRARFEIASTDDPTHTGLTAPASVAALAFRVPWFVRHFVIDRWFLHAHQPPLDAMDDRAA